jgi:hypothetical protein
MGGPIMPDTSEIELYVMIDSQGDYVVAADPDDLVELFQETHSGVSTVTAVYSVQLTVPTPAARVIRAQVTKNDAPVRIKIEES